MKTLLILILLVVIAGALWLRFSPIDPDLWHVDPADVDNPGASGIRLIGREAPRFPGKPDDVLDAFADIALTEPRVRILDGGKDEGMMTFVARSRIFGFPDFITVKAVSEGAETKLSVASHARFRAGSDWGVNRERLDRWFAELEQRLR